MTEDKVQKAEEHLSAIKYHQEKWRNTYGRGFITNARWHAREITRHIDKIKSLGFTIDGCTLVPSKKAKPCLE